MNSFLFNNIFPEDCWPKLNCIFKIRLNQCFVRGTIIDLSLKCMHFLLHESILLGLLAATWHSMVLLSLWSTSTSRCVSITDYPPVCFAFIFLSPKWIRLHFSIFNLIWHVGVNPLFCQGPPVIMLYLVSLHNLVSSANTEIELLIPNSYH